MKSLFAKKILKKLSPILFLIVASCVSNPPDNPVCKELEPTRAFCVRPLSGAQFMVDETHPYEGKTWWEMRPTNLSVPASTWAAQKAYVIKMCKKTKKCDEEVSTWERTLTIIDSQVEQSPK